jgi:hypothetical protein
MTPSSTAEFNSARRLAWITRTVFALKPVASLSARSFLMRPRWSCRIRTSRKAGSRWLSSFSL